MPKKIAVVTGASSGLGKEFVKLLCGLDEVEEVWAVARNLEKLEKLRELFGEKVRPFSKDLSDLRQIEGVSRILARENPDVRWLVNSAGFAKFCSYGDLSMEEAANMISLNCTGVVAMGMVCLPFMNKGSHILNISSQASFQPLPYQNLYSSTKAFVRNYSRALNVELKERGIMVTAVCPGWMDTEFYDRAEIGAEKATRRYVGMVPPSRVAVKALRDAQKGKDISVYSLFVKCAHLVAKMLPQRTMMKLWLIQQGL